MNQPVHVTVQMATVEIPVHVSSQYALFCCTSLHLVRYAVESVYPTYWKQTPFGLDAICNTYICIRAIW